MRTAYHAHGLRKRSALVALGLVTAIAGCQNDLPIRSVDKPPAPDMQALIDAYDVPSGTLGAGSVAELARAVVDRVSTADGLKLDQHLIDAARQAVMQLANNNGAPPALPQATQSTGPQANAQALTLKGKGYLVVTRICDGWGAVPVPDLANGLTQLTVGFDEQAVDPVIWGTLAMCKYRVGEHTVELDGREPDRSAGDLRAFIGPNITLANFTALPNPVLIELVAQASLDGVAVLGHWSARITVATRALEVLVPLADGNVVVSVDAGRSSLVQVRAANGLFSCDYQALRCTDPSGRQLGAQ